MIPMIMGCCAQGTTPTELDATVFSVTSGGASSLSIDPGISATVDWGDGTVETITEPTDHVYAAGSYIGSVRHVATEKLTMGGDALVSVSKFQSNLTGICFRGNSPSSNLVSVPPSIPSSVNDLAECFIDATLFNGDISGWDVSGVTTFDNMFTNASSFNGDLSSWDVSSATDMSYMFSNAVSFNSNISGWSVGGVNRSGMSGMFSNATSFNQDLSGWCVSLIGFAPVIFDFGASSWVLPRPVWGTCPGG